MAHARWEDCCDLERCKDADRKMDRQRWRERDAATGKRREWQGAKETMHEGPMLEIPSVNFCACATERRMERAREPGGG